MTQLQIAPDLLPRTRRVADTWRALGVLGGLAAINVVAHRTDIPAAAVIPIGAASVATVAVLSGHTLRDLGLHRQHLRRGLRWAGICVAAIATVVGLVLVMPGGAALFADNRFPALAPALLAAFVTIPLTTVLPEELLFRGVLDGSLDRVMGPKTAYAAGALAFGLWHALTALSLASGNDTVRGLVGNGVLGQIACMGSVVAVTSVAGLGLSWLRRKTGSLLAPIGLHWALNAIGALAAGAVGSGIFGR